MAKEKVKLDWVPLNVEAMPEEVQTLYSALKDCFEQTKVAKAALETKISAMLKAKAAKLPDEVKGKLLVHNGKIPDDVDLKFGYLGGIAVAATAKGKSRANAVTL